MTSSSGSFKVICKVWKHSHENLPMVGVDIYGRVTHTRPKDPPFKYMISFKRGNELCVTEVMAVDELDAVKQFYKEK